MFGICSPFSSRNFSEGGCATNYLISPLVLAWPYMATTLENMGRVNTLVMVRSGMGEYAGAARRRVHLATVLLRPPSGHRPGRRQARRAHSYVP